MCPSNELTLITLGSISPVSLANRLCVISQSCCACSYAFYRPVGGHVGCTCQLQHHSERTEAFLQQAARGKRPVGESESPYNDPFW